MTELVAWVNQKRGSARRQVLLISTLYPLELTLERGRAEQESLLPGGRPGDRSASILFNCQVDYLSNQIRYR